MPSPYRLLSRAVLLSLGLLLVVLLPASAAAEATSDLDKRDVPASRLLLPYYKVEADNPSGASTLWALRNESLVFLPVTIEYYEADSPQAPQKTVEIILGPKEIRTGNIRDVPDLEVGPDGFAIGYVIFTADGVAGDLYGDYFIVTSDQDFAEGSLLLDATETEHSDLCNLFSLRWLKGAAFGGSTEVIVWVESDSAPLDPGTVTYVLYSASGVVQSFGNLFLDDVTTRLDIAGLAPANLNGGALEVQFADGVRGHVAVAMAATGRYSVGFDAVCKN